MPRGPLRWAILLHKVAPCCLIAGFYEVYKALKTGPAILAGEVLCFKHPFSKIHVSVCYRIWNWSLVPSRQVGILALNPVSRIRPTACPSFCHSSSYKENGFKLSFSFFSSFSIYKNNLHYKSVGPILQAVLMWVAMWTVALYQSVCILGCFWTEWAQIRFRFALL